MKIIRWCTSSILIVSLMSCGFEEIPQKQKTTYEKIGGNDNYSEADDQKDDDNNGPSSLVHEVDLKIAEKKTKYHFCQDYESLAACELDWNKYQNEELVFRNFNFKLALVFEDEKLIDVACGFNSPEGNFYPGEFSREHGLCFAYYYDYTGEPGLFDLYVVNEEQLIPDNLIIFMFDSVNLHIVDSETMISFSHEYRTGKQEFKVR